MCKMNLMSPFLINLLIIALMYQMSALPTCVCACVLAFRCVGPGCVIRAYQQNELTAPLQRREVMALHACFLDWTSGAKQLKTQRTCRDLRIQLIATSWHQLKVVILHVFLIRTWTLELLHLRFVNQQKLIIEAIAFIFLCWWTFFPYIVFILVWVKHECAYIEM